MSKKKLIKKLVEKNIKGFAVRYAVEGHGISFQDFVLTEVAKQLVIANK